MNSDMNITLYVTKPFPQPSERKSHGRTSLNRTKDIPVHSSNLSNMNTQYAPRLTISGSYMTETSILVSGKAVHPTTIYCTWAVIGLLCRASLSTGLGSVEVCL